MAFQASNFWDKQAKSYSAKPVKDQQSYQQMLDAMSAHLKPDDLVLEIGCGTGSTAILMAERVKGWIAIDISPEMIKIAKTKNAPASADFRVAGADTTFSEAPFDVVCGFHILHLVPDPQQTLKALYAQLKPGGLFISKTVCVGEANILLKLLIPVLTRIGIAPLVHKFSISDLKAMMEDIGFEILDRRTFGTHTKEPYFVARRPA